jgi:ribonuclease PH
MGKGGWLSAEYAMLPGSTTERKKRDTQRPDGRSVEIQRLIGRALRAVVRLEALPAVTLWVDCDVIQADGGTRTAAITGSYVALGTALRRLAQRGTVKNVQAVLPVSVSAVSVGIVNNEIMVDLDYTEDSSAAADLNVVTTGEGKVVEVTGAAEKGAFERRLLDQMIDAGFAANAKLQAFQEAALAAWKP